MALNLDTTFKLKAKVEGARSVQDFKKQLTGLDKSSKMSKAQLGKMNIEINRMARAAGNTTKGLRNHIKALTLLRERTEIGGRAYKRLGNQIDGLKRKLKGLDGQAASTGTKLASMLATVGVGRAIRGVVRGASDYQEEVTKTAAIEGGGANFAQIDEGIRATAQVAAGTPQEVAELATELARMGRTADEITGSLNGIVLGAEATSTSFADMGRIVGTTMQVFDIDVSKTERAVDILTAGANNSAQNILILGESLKMAAPTAATLGLTLNDTVATLGLLANAGIKGSEAGTGLKTGLQRLQIAASGADGKLLGITRGSKMLTTAMKELGAEVLGADGKLKPMDETLKALRDGIAGRDEGEQMEIMKALFGTDQGSKFLALIGQSDEKIDAMFSKIRNSAEVTQRTRKAMDSFGLTTKILGGNFEIVTNNIGAAMISVLHPLARLLNSFLTLVSGLPAPIQAVGSAAAAAGLAATGLAVAIGTFKALGAVELLKPIILSLKGMALGFLGAAKAAIIFLATNPFGWAIIGVTLIIAFRKQLVQFAKNIAKFVGDFIESKKHIIDNIMGIGKGFVKMINEFIIKTLNKLSKIPIIGKIFGKYLGAYQKIGEIVVDISDKASETISNAKDVITKGVEKGKDVATDVITNVTEGASNILGGGDGILNKPIVDDDTKDKQSQVLTGMKAGLEDYAAKVNDVAGNIKNAMGNALQGMEDALVNFVLTGKLAFKDLARSIIADLTRIAIQQAIMKPFTGWLTSIFGSANGNVISGGEIVPYKSGGIVSRPTYFPMKDGMGLMGEAGAEAIMPLQRGRNGKLGVQASGGMGNIVVNVDASGSSVEGDENQARNLGRMIGVAVQTELLAQKRPGGILAS